MSDQENFQQEGYADAEPVSPDENPGDVSKELNRAAHDAYAEAHLTGTGREGETDAPPPDSES